MSDQIEVELDLCHEAGRRDDIAPSYGGASFYRDDRPEGTWQRFKIPGNYFTCASESNGLNIFPCTGSEHRGGVLVICTCTCHTSPPQPMPRTPWSPEPTR